VIRRLRDEGVRIARRLATPLFWYYAITIVIPIANGAASNRDFAEHALVVLVLPVALVLALGGVTTLWRPRRHS